MDGDIKKNSLSVETLIFLLVIVFAYLTTWQAAQLSIILFSLPSIFVIPRIAVAAEMP